MFFLGASFCDIYIYFYSFVVCFVLCVFYLARGVIFRRSGGKFGGIDIKGKNGKHKIRKKYSFAKEKKNKLCISIDFFQYFHLKTLLHSLFYICVFRSYMYFWCNGQVLWLTICTAAVGFLPEGDTKRKMVHNVLIHCFVFLSSALSAVINYHDIQNRPGRTGICVANHTSPIDVLVLMCDNCYSLVSKGMRGIKPFVIALFCIGFG